MQFAISKKYYFNTNAQMDIIGNISAYLKNHNFNEIIYLDECMSSFDMNDILLVPPKSSIRSCQQIYNKSGYTNWNVKVRSYIWRLIENLYGECNRTITQNKIATTTAIIIDEVLKNNNQFFFCTNKVCRGNNVMTEMEVAFRGYSLNEVRYFYKSLLSHILKIKTTIIEVPTIFSWSEVSIAFRGVNGEKYGALGFIKKEILCLSRDVTKPVCILGLPLATFMN